ncbi:MAG: peptidoglycan-associated lipoprotein Pal [Alphaproteobacteria bacterium]|nr:peptidoglycan-associated lipoprotein Pal [Alphaproteobacteria bacterium]
MKPRIIYMLVALAVLAGCKDRDQDQKQMYDNRGAQAQRTTASDAEYMEEYRRAFFDFDSAVIRDDARDTLRVQADYLKENPDIKVVVEGHCDERGTREYNLALGYRRADASKKVIAGAGVDAGRIKTVSYGKDRPWKTGTGEEVWRYNRNTTTIIQ